MSGNKVVSLFEIMIVVENLCLHQKSHHNYHLHYMISFEGYIFDFDTFLRFFSPSQVNSPNCEVRNKPFLELVVSTGSVNICEFECSEEKLKI